MARPARDLVGVGAAATSLLLWSAAFAAIRAALEHFSFGHVVLGRFLLASLGLGVVAAATRLPTPARRDLPAIAAMGLTGITTYHVALTYGEIVVTAGSAAVLVNVAPIFTALLAAGVLGARIAARQAAGIAVGFSGTAVIALGEGEPFHVEPVTFVLLLPALAFAVYMLLQKPLLGRYRPVHLVIYAVWAGTIPTLVFAPGFVSAARSAPTEALLAVAYLAIGPTVIAYLTWSIALARTDATSLASTLYLVPALAIGVAWVWLGELPTVLALAGATLALGGVALARSSGRSSARPPRDERATRR